jgi:hypothetical protein
MNDDAITNKNPKDAFIPSYIAQNIFTVLFVSDDFTSHENQLLWQDIAAKFTNMINSIGLAQEAVQILNLYYANGKEDLKSFAAIARKLQITTNINVVDQLHQSLSHIFTKSNEKFPETVAYLLIMQNPRAAGSEFCASRKRIAELEKQVAELTAEPKVEARVDTQQLKLFELLKQKIDPHFRKKINDLLKKGGSTHIIDVVHRSRKSLLAILGDDVAMLDEVITILYALDKRLRVNMEIDPNVVQDMETVLRRTAD